MYNRVQIRQVFRQLLVIGGVLLLSRFTKNWGFVFVALYGVSCCLRRDMGRALVVFLLLSFLPMVNPFIMPRYGQFAMIARLSSLLMALALLVSGIDRPGPHRLPLDLLFLYLFIAAFSSLQGYAPLVSELKIVNFTFLLLAIAIGTRNLHRNPADIQLLRNTYLAVIAITVYGSLLTLPFPHIAYMTSLRNIMVNWGMEYAYDVAASGKSLLFCGATAHSQFLGPMSACCLGWLLCDMWLVEKRWNLLHVVLLIPIPFICYMTRARIGLLSLAVAVFANVFLCLPQTNLPRRTKTKFYGAVILLLFALLSTALVSEFTNRAISRWIRKTDDVSSDDRALGDAFTQSRQGAIATNLADFRRNRLLGSGFQVAQKMQEQRRSTSSLFSAPIEKGLLPLMVLGESGLVGTSIFILFLVVFFSTCHQKRYTATAVLFTVFLTTNMAEATFFSPSGGGGVYWSLMVVGGFTIDMAVVANRRPTPEALYCPLPDDVSDADVDEFNLESESVQDLNADFETPPTENV